MAKTDLTFSALSRANRRRCETVFHPIDAWSMTDWMTAVAGEVGEAANMIKKARRAEGKTEAELDMDSDVGLDFPYDNADEHDHARYITGRELIGYELADAVIYIDLLCQRLGIELGEMVTRKFNIVSRCRQSITLLPETENQHAAKLPHVGPEYVTKGGDPLQVVWPMLCVTEQEVRDALRRSGESQPMPCSEKAISGEQQDETF